MAKDSKKLVQAITSQEENFAQWYTDICVKAELVEYSSVKGFIILRPYGQAIWELIQKDMDARFKATGHENVAMPVLIPESLLQKEGELVNGFAPEVAWVTMGGSDKLEERLAVRPTSETMFCDHWSRVLHSYRELPMKYNQWCSVIRWEKTTRPFLRSREFWWQEGHTIHETAAEAEAETQQQLNCYADTCEQDLAIPVVKGRKTDKEKFADDSFCMAGLRTGTIGICEKDTGRNITCKVEGYPYSLIWSAPAKPVRFVCIEPWHSLPAAATDPQDWEQRAAAACLAPGESWQTTLSTTFER